MNVLLFQLYGPLSSWGVIAVGQVRNTQTHPSKSGVFGLVAACLGYRRSDTLKHELLYKKLSFACRIHGSGTIMTDFHTSQVGNGSKMDVSTRKKALETGTVNTILSSREYIQDEYCVVALWGSDGLLSEIEKALKNPIFTPYLGRKSCPPSLPFAPKLIETENPLKSLITELFPFETENKYVSESHPGLYFDADQKYDDFTPTMILERRDISVNRQRWSFRSRKEAFYSLEKGTDHVSESN